MPSTLEPWRKVMLVMEGLCISLTVSIQKDNLQGLLCLEKSKHILQ